MRIVIALGGNALLQRGQPLEADTQIKNIRQATKAIAAVAREHQVILCHGNGPQIGLLALQNQAYTATTPYPLDILGAQTQGMIGYLLQQNLQNNLNNQLITTILTQVRVDRQDPAFHHPSKPIGPVYHKATAENLMETHGWHMAIDGDHYRRVVPSPKPQEILELHSIESLLAHNALVLCAGGGGIPVYRTEDDQIQGIEAVIDKDLTSALLAITLDADKFIILTDVPQVTAHWGTPQAQPLRHISVDKLAALPFAKGSMGPKIQGVCDFVQATGHKAHIGALSHAKEILHGESGTTILPEPGQITYY